MDIVILTTSKDENKVPYVVNSLYKYLMEDINRIICVSPRQQLKKINNVEYYLDEDVIDYDFNQIVKEARPNWYKQQFIKLLQKVSDDDYLVIDSDILLNKPIKIIENGKPAFFLGRDQFNIGYFDLMKKIFGFGRIYNHSFINEIMFFKREYVNKLINIVSDDENIFIDKIVNEINSMVNANYDKNAFFSEYETYGNFIFYKHTDEYILKKNNVLLNGFHRPWYNHEIEDYIKKQEDSNYDIISMHSWC